MEPVCNHIDLADLLPPPDFIFDNAYPITIFAVDLTDEFQTL